MKKINIIVPVLLCLAVGFLASHLQSDSLENWYPGLVKSAVTPPNAAFPVAWTILYICMGVSIGLVLNQGRTPERRFLTTVFAVQLALNFSWSLVFFYFRSPLGGLLVITMLAAAIIYYAVTAWPVSRSASVLFWPYFLWVTFAAYLNAFILLHN